MKSTRKYILAVCALALGLAVPSVRAEQDSPRPKKEAGPRGDRLAMMKEKLGLSDAQVEQLKKIFAEEREQLKALREKEGDKKAKHEEMLKIREAFKAKIEAVLTAEQKAKFEEMRKKHEGPDGEKGPKGPPPDEKS
ncbi:MAG TPA: hypothetical protein VIO38_07055 [Rariglobus sp.]